jgi:hypothetical protein
MRRNDVRFAVAAREDGLRRVRSLTTRIGAVGVVSSAAIAVALGHPAGAAVHTPAGNGAGSQNRTGRSGDSPASAPANSAPASSQQAPSQPSSAPSSSSPQATSQPSLPQPPVQNPAPTAAPSQAVSGGS